MEAAFFPSFQVVIILYVTFVDILNIFDEINS